MRPLRLVAILFFILAVAGCASKGEPRTVMSDGKAIKLEGKEKRDPYFLFVRADLLAMEGKTKRSTSQLKRLIEEDPGVAYYHFLLAQNYALEGRLPASTSPGRCFRRGSGRSGPS